MVLKPQPVHLASSSRGARLRVLPPLALYVHLPWCLRKCPYCDFNSHEARPSDEQQRGYVAALLADLEAALPAIWGRPVVSVFIGGGTPSLFEPEQIDHLLAGVRARLRLLPDCEITLEANPGTFERARFRAFRSAGVTRLSVGVQSFDDAALQSLGRVHDGRQARAALEEAASTFATFNIDLMYALPGQSLTHLQADLESALAFAPPHLSVYHLTLEPNTRFAKYPPKDLPDEDTAWAMSSGRAGGRLHVGRSRWALDPPASRRRVRAPPFKEPITMPGLYFEDFELGRRFDHEWTRTVTEMDNVLYSTLTMNVQPLHIDRHFAAQTEFGRPLVNSLFTLGLVIGMSVNDTTFRTTVANLGMSEVSFPAPVFAGDTLHVRTTVLSKRESKSRPNAGIVEFEHVGLNQDDQVVCVCKRAAFMHKRPVAT